MSVSIIFVPFSCTFFAFFRGHYRDQVQGCKTFPLPSYNPFLAKKLAFILAPVEIGFDWLCFALTAEFAKDTE